MHPGECVGLLGPSGAGKSTLLRCLSGTQEISRGELLYQGQSFSAHRATLRPQIGLVPQDDIVHLSLTPDQELSFASRLRLPDLPEKERQARVEGLLQVLEIAAVRHTRIRRLSGGQRKRVSIAVELLSQPQVLFLDEPTSGLDPALEEKTMQLFQGLSREGRTVLLTTHVMESLDVLDKILILVQGRMVFFGPPELALEMFQARSFSKIYTQIAQANPAELERRFRQSSLYQEFVRQARPSPRASSPRATPTPSGPRSKGAPALSPSPAPGSRPPGPAESDDLDQELEALKRELEA